MSETAEPAETADVAAPRRAAIQFAIYAAFLLAIIATATVGGTDVVFGFLRAVPAGDKIGHFVLVGTLALLADRALGYRALRRVPMGPLAVGVFAVGDELSQLFIAQRTFDLLDLAANFAGIVSLTALGRFALRGSPSSRRRAGPPATRSPGS